jgi:uncharacterized protein involved in exopolysaccharide biosynthesis
MEQLESPPQKQTQTGVGFSASPEFYQHNREKELEDEIDLLEIFKFFWNYKKVILLFSIIGTLLSTAFVILRPKPPEYEAVSTFVRIEEGQSNSANLSGLSGIASLMGVSTPSSSSSSKIEIIVNSRLFLETIIEKLDLLPIIYGKDYDPNQKVLIEKELTFVQKIKVMIKSLITPNKEEKESEENVLVRLYPPIEYNSYPYILNRASKILAGQLQLNRNKDDGLYSVIVKWVNPALVAKLANQIVTELIAELEKNQFSSNQKEQSFLDDQLTVANDNFKQSEDDLRAFLEKYGFSAEQHASIIASSIGSLKSSIEAEELQLKITKELQGDENAQVSLSEMKIKVLKERLSELETGAVPKGNKEKFKSSNVSLKDIPALSIEYKHLTGELGIRQEIVKMLRMQSEKLEIAKAKEVERIRIIDRAIPPKDPIKTRRILYVIAGLFFGFMIGTGYSYILQFRKNRLTAVEGENLELT